MLQKYIFSAVRKSVHTAARVAESPSDLFRGGAGERTLIFDGRFANRNMPETCYARRDAHLARAEFRNWDAAIRA